MSRTKKRKAGSLVLIATMLVTIFAALNLPGQTVAEEVYQPSVTEGVYTPASSAPVPAPPQRPTGFVVEDQGTGREVLLSWNINSELNIIGYLITRTSAENGAFGRIGGGAFDTDRPYYLDMSVEPGVTYWYRVSAVNSAGLVSEPSETVAVTVLDITPPAAVEADIMELDSGHELKLVWQSGVEDDLAAYRVYRATEEEGIFTEIAVLDSGQDQYVDQELIQGQWYRYYVAAADTSGNVSDPSEILTAKPRAALRVPVDGGAAAVSPDDLYVKLNSNVLLLGIRNDSIRMSARAVDGEGMDVPVKGTWRFAADFGAFRRVRTEGESVAVAHFYADREGEGEIAVEFYPEGSLKPAASVSLPVRALDWYLRFDGRQSLTANAGEEYGVFTATVTDGHGQPVTEPAARIRFESVEVKRNKENRLVQAGLAASRADSLLTVVYDGQKLGVSGSSPDNNGQVSAVFEASVDPGQDRIRAVLYYDDYSGMEAHPKMVAESDYVQVDVVPGEAAFIAWEPAEVEIGGMAPVMAAYSWYDLYGNRTDAPNDATVYVQVPERLPLEIMSAGDWNGAGAWIELQPEQKLHIRVADGAGIVREGYYIVNTRIKGETGLPPAGLGQANRPLQVTVAEDFMPPRQQLPWLREVGALIGRISMGLACWFKNLLPWARGV